MLFFLFASGVEAALWSNEGSVTLKAGEKKAIHGVACVYSENPVPATYTVSFPGLDKLVDRVEPSGFTIDRVPCGGGGEGRKCIASLCNSGSNYTRVITAYFKAPVEFSFKKCSLSIYGQMEDYKGVMKATGVVGAATTSEPVSFYVHYYPFNGWLIVVTIVTIIVVVISVAIIKHKRKSKPSQLQQAVLPNVKFPQ